jgi:Zn finger protein HypA/HybF involved in hydrogenase expression
MTYCEHCQGAFLVPTNDKRGRRFCSLRCANLARGVAGEAKRRSAYALDPKQCKRCDGPLTFEQNRANNTYCSKSCGAAINGLGRVRKRREAVCQNCNITFLAGKTSTETYCSKACTHTAAKKRMFTKFAEGSISTRATLKKHFMEVTEYKCVRCGIADWLGESIVLQLDHIDGDASNNKPTNLRLLCPNCHCQTETWGGRNRGSGRKARGLPLN